MRRLLAVAAATAATLAATLFVASTPSQADTTRAWAHNHVYVVDSTDNNWPVGTAAVRDAYNSNLVLTWTTRCPSRTATWKPQCIWVNQAPLTGNTIGTTKIYWSGSRIVAARVTLDTRYEAWASYENRLADAEHEIGHAVGLVHSTDTASIMYPDAGLAHNPDAADYANLRLRYNAADRRY